MTTHSLEVLVFVVCMILWGLSLPPYADNYRWASGALAWVAVLMLGFISGVL
jgi:hypothetical protein